MFLQRPFAVAFKIDTLIKQKMTDDLKNFGEGRRVFGMQYLSFDNQKV